MKSTNIHRGITKKSTIYRVTVLVHCTSSQCPLPLYLVSLNLLELFRSYALDKKSGTSR